MRFLTLTGDPALDADVELEAVDCLKDGGLIVYPTDTLYGLGADATNDKAVERLFEAKRRPADEPLPILIGYGAELSGMAREVPALALRLASSFWPGALTIVLERAPQFHSLALAGGDSVALRVPANEFVLAVARQLGRPITGTSANISGLPAPRTALEAAQQVGDKVDIIVDGGPCPIGRQSTVVDLRGKPRLLRDGAISRAALEEVIGPLESDEE